MAVATEVIRRSMSTLAGLFTKKLPAGIWQFTFDEVGKGMKYVSNGRRYEFMAINGVMGITIDATNEKQLWYVISDDCTVQIEEVGQSANPFYNIILQDGLFTPLLTCDTPGDLAVTYTTQSGFYTLIGDMVFYNIAITIATISHTTAAGNWIVSGLPYTSVNQTNRIWIGKTYLNQVDLPGALDFGAVIVPNTSQMNFTASSDNAAREILDIADTTISANDYFRINGFYKKA